MALHSTARVLTDVEKISIEERLATISQVTLDAFQQTGQILEGHPHLGDQLRALQRDRVAFHTWRKSWSSDTQAQEEAIGDEMRTKNTSKALKSIQSIIFNVGEVADTFDEEEDAEQSQEAVGEQMKKLHKAIERLINLSPAMRATYSQRLEEEQASAQRPVEILSYLYRDLNQPATQNVTDDKVLTGVRDADEGRKRTAGVKAYRHTYKNVETKDTARVFSGDWYRSAECMDSAFLTSQRGHYYDGVKASGDSMVFSGDMVGYELPVPAAPRAAASGNGK